MSGSLSNPAGQSVPPSQQAAVIIPPVFASARNTVHLPKSSEKPAGRTSPENATTQTGPYTSAKLLKDCGASWIAHTENGRFSFSLGDTKTPSWQIHGSEAYRRAMVRVFARKALERAAAR